MKKGLLITVLAAIAAIVAALIFSTYIGEPHPERARWVLADETVAWLGRGCVELQFEGRQPAIETALSGQEAIVRFNDAAETRFTGRLRGRSMVVRQTLPTTETGRFCGQDLQVQLQLRISGDDPQEVVGSWRALGCDMCRTRSFSAVREDLPWSR